MRRFKNVLLIHILTIAPLLFIFDASGSNTHTYYRQLIISPKYEITGHYIVNERFVKRVNCYDFKYNKKGKLTRITYLKNGKPAIDNYIGVAKIKIRYNKEGTQFRHYYNQKNKPITDKINGVYATSVIYDSLRSIISMKCYDENLKFMKDKYNITNYVIKLDANNNIESLAYCDERGKILNTDVYRVKYDYYQDDNSVDQYFSDHQGNILAVSDNIIKVKKVYNDKGNLIEERYLDKNGELVEASLSEIAVTKWEFDKNGNLLEESVYGADMKLKEDAVLQIAKTKWRYDAKGNVLEEKYYGLDNKLTDKNNHELFRHAIIRWKYDKKGKIEAIQYFNTKRKLISIIEHPNDEITRNN